MTIYSLEQDAKRLELLISIALRDGLHDEADDLSDDLYFVHRLLATAGE